MEKPMDAKRLEKIQRYIKNRLDISDLIDGYSIKGLDLSRAIIFGLLFSTLLTLLVTPAALMLKSRFLSGDSAEKSKKVKKQVKYS